MIKVFSETPITLYSYESAEVELIEDPILAYELPSYAVYRNKKYIGAIGKLNNIYSFCKANEDIMLTNDEIVLCNKIAERKNNSMLTLIDKARKAI